MKAYFYKTTKNNKKFICSKFDNSYERVTIYHEDGNIYQQYWQQGAIEYESKTGNLVDNIPNLSIISVNDVGHITSHVWRPGLCLELPLALEIDEGEKARAKRDLKILIERLHEILLYVEPAQTCLKVYGHKIRELLILACTECENAWASYMRFAGNNNARLTTNDYVKLKEKLFLNDYCVTFFSHPIVQKITPFGQWNAQNPTTSLSWYDSYNKTKHNKDKFFSEATLEHCLNAIAANIVMFCVRYSPYELLNSNDICSKLINEYFSIELIAPKIETFYIPYLKSVQMATGAFSAPLASTFEQNWIIDPLVL